MVFRDDAGSLVARLKGRVRQYAVTNGTRVAQERKLSRSGLDRMLDGVFISEIVGTEKPGAAFFDAVFSQIGPCCRDEVMIVGDSSPATCRGDAAPASCAAGTTLWGSPARQTPASTMTSGTCAR
ncbi:MAG: HAD family hydrolase [Flavonifractor plautii]